MVSVYIHSIYGRWALDNPLTYLIFILMCEFDFIFAVEHKFARFEIGQHDAKTGHTNGDAMSQQIAQHIHRQQRECVLQVV